ncbi:hypothetical protein ASG11_05460 [Sphingomonas sp. Leaf357]|uniref:alpha/beta hydrolase domain-containing protein n=1 Tax=Sphingomonas sp. Leaf357 TaxID=1736350 RepID=UPI0006FB0543|nr:alpha/beta hydrolase domain-containing protein [Sphingomonas sp. Leaf357]KQS03761.1 hypothetical protein ASG11_05460 [Sphingomonas sp. Leaf357]
MMPNTNRRQALALGVAAGAGALLPGIARAATRAMPRLRALPEAGKYGVLVWDVGGLGYVAEEYVMSGQADVLQSVSMADAVDMSKRDGAADFANRDFTRKVVSANQPYATRVLVYRPADWKAFSGNVVIEVLHPGGGGRSIVWGHSHEMLARRGDAYIGVQPPLTLPGLLQVAPKRYEGVTSVHPTQLWDAVIDAATLSRAPGGLLPGGRVRRQVLTGYSYTGVVCANFANFHHDRARSANGRPLIDGYLPMACATFVQPLDVPVMRLNTQSEFNGTGGIAARTPDRDDMAGRARHYELAGASHVTIERPLTRAKPPTITVPEAAGLPKFSPAACYAGFPAGSSQNDYPVHLVVDAMLANMFDWIEKGVAPPRAPLIATDAAGATLLDPDGNAIGGLRLPPVSVPAAAYGVGTGQCRNFGYTSPFTEQRKRALHGDHAAYVAKVRSAAERLVAERWLLPEAVAVLAASAQASKSF